MLRILFAYVAKHIAVAIHRYRLGDKYSAVQFELLGDTQHKRLYASLIVPFCSRGVGVISTLVHYYYRSAMECYRSVVDSTNIFGGVAIVVSNIFA